MQTATCPPSEQLKAYLSGKLDPDSSESLAHHLQDCEHCGQAATQLEQEPDTLVELLQAGMPTMARNPETSHRGSTGISCDIFPKILGQYELQSKLGVGGMGAVYLARHQSLDKQVAIKLLPALPAQNAEFVARFQREMRAAGKLEHPAIVRTTDAGERQGIHFLVMEAIDGMNLSRIARAEGKLAIADACEVVRQAALGLAHAHEKGIVHRDIKPSNLMLDTAGQVRILDFGLAQIGFWESGSAEITTVGQMMGTLDYMAPEQAERSGAVDYRADLYSLGATLFRLLTSRAPLAAAPNLTPIEKLRLLATHRPPRLRSLRSDVPDDLGQIVDAMLAREPSGRPASAIHTVELLEPFCAGADLVGLLKRARSRPEVEEPQVEVHPLLQRDLIGLEDNWHAIGADSVGQATSQGESEKHDQMDSDSRASINIGKRVGGGWLTRLALVGIAGLLCAGLWLVLETSKGQLVIESQANVQVKILEVSGDERMDTGELQIEPGTQATRLRSGQYEITLDAASDSFSVTNESFTIRNGQTVVARILPKAVMETQVLTANGSMVDHAGGEASANRLTELVYDGQTLDTWLQRLKFERNSDEITRVLTAIAALSDVSLRDILEQPMVEFIISRGVSRFDWGVAASCILVRCCGQHYYDTVAKLLPRLNDDSARSWFLQFSECLYITVPAKNASDFSLFLNETELLLRSDSPDIVQQTATVLRYIADGLTGKPAAKEVQNSILQQLLNAPLVNNENFWLANPYSYELSIFSHGICNINHVSLTGCKPLNDESFQRGLTVLVDTQSSAQAVTQAAIVLRTLVESGSKLSEPQQGQLAEGLKFHLTGAVGDTEKTLLDVSIPRALGHYAAPILPHVQFSRSNPTSEEANKLISILNLVQVVGLKNLLSSELAQLQELFSELPLMSNQFASDLKEPHVRFWDTLQKENKSLVVRPMIIGKDLNSAAIYLQTGFLLGIDSEKLFGRFEEQRQADLERLVNYLASEIETGKESRIREAITMLNGIPRANLPQQLADVVEKHIATEVGLSVINSHQGISVWQRAAGKEFPTSFVRALSRLDGEQKKILLSSFPLVLQGLQCSEPAELEPLLEWCDTIMVDCPNVPSGDLCWSAISMLASLTSNTQGVSTRCQQQVVERLENYSFLTDENFWVQTQLPAMSLVNHGPVMRQARLRRAIQLLQRAVEADASVDGNLECHALAIVMQVLEDKTPMPNELSLIFENYVRERLEAASNEPIALSQTYFFPPESSVLTVPQLAKGILYRRHAGPSNGVANPIILILNILSRSTNNQNRELIHSCQSALETLHRVIEELEIKGSDFSGHQLSDWNQKFQGASSKADLVMHTWYLQTGVLLGKDLGAMCRRPEQLLWAERKQLASKVQPHDTLAIHIPGLLPSSGDPPVLQAGKNPPVVGFPVPVSKDGLIQLPLLKPIPVKDLELSQVLANIEQAYTESKIISSDQPPGITVQFLMRAEYLLELRNITGSPAIAQPNQ